MSSDQIEDVESFRARARTWIRANLAPGEVIPAGLRSRPDEEELAAVARDREVQRGLFDAGLAGACVPREYGGQGLTLAHQRALNDELAGYEYPVKLQVPTMTPCMAVLLEFGTEAQKLAHIPAILKGEEIWMQFLSEPSGGSDVAGALTSAVREGDEWILNGSKIWTTGAWWSDWGLVLARTNWDVPKHRGLTVFIMPINQPSVTVSRIEMLNGNREFCQEYLSDTRVPDTDRIGAVDNGWTVGTRWMMHERLQHNSPFVTAPAGGRGAEADSMLEIARDAGRLHDPLARDLVGEALTLDLVMNALNRRVGAGIASGTMSDQGAAVGRLLSCLYSARRSSIAFEIADGFGAAWSDEDGEAAERGTDFLMRQIGSIGGGTTEMARNVVAERVLGMPREANADRDVAFRDVPRGSSRR
jgi:alkylation response protein AidB-like acyl-CoA dehydrogenase